MTARGQSFRKIPSPLPLSVEQRPLSSLAPQLELSSHANAKHPTTGTKNDEQRRTAHHRRKQVPRAGSRVYGGSGPASRSRALTCLVVAGKLPSVGETRDEPFAISTAPAAHRARCLALRLRRSHSARCRR